VSRHGGDLAGVDGQIEGGTFAVSTPLAQAGQLRPQASKGQTMLGIIALVLVVLWLLGFFAFHVTTAAIHIILVIAVILIVLHFVQGRRTL
jgi:hypothetical protein